MLSLTDEMKRNLGIAAACTGGVAMLLYPAALGYKGQHYIREILEGGGHR